MAKDTYGNPSTPVTATTIDTDYGAAVVDRVVPVYPTTTARDAAIPSPDEGQMVVVTADDEVQVYDGSAWSAILVYTVGDPDSDADTASGTDTDTSYVDLDEFGGLSSVSVTVTTGTTALVMLSATLANATAGSTTYLAYRVSGATTVGEATARSINYESGVAGDRARFGSSILHEGLTAGSNTFTLRGKVSSGSGTISGPVISVVPL